MIYLAILLILTGLLIILTALFLETRKVNSRIDDISQYHARAEQREPAEFDPENIEIDLPDSDNSDYGSRGAAPEAGSIPDIDEEIFISFDDSDGYSGEGESFDFDEGEIDENRPFSGEFDVADEIRKTVSEEDDETGPVSAVMFDDQSGIIDYDSGDGIIDSTLKSYKNIKREGSGELLIDADGLNFYLDGSLYRFDFHRLSRLWTGKNYIAIQLKGGNSIKLFIIHQGESLIKRAEDYYSSSRKD